VRAALERTRGRVLFEGERVVDARFCAACGGRTANARDLAPEADFACLRAVDCETCSREWTRTQDAGPDDVGWRASIDAAELAKAFGFDGPCTELTPIRDDGAGRWITVRARAARSGTGDATRELSFAELRAKLGPRLASPWIVACELAPDGRATFVGRGRGHGVGLCQRGARGLALEGFDAERILAHYFPGALVGALER
jgi:stage II sporulation protein D